MLTGLTATMVGGYNLGKALAQIGRDGSKQAYQFTTDRMRRIEVQDNLLGRVLRRSRKNALIGTWGSIGTIFGLSAIVAAATPLAMAGAVGFTAVSFFGASRGIGSMYQEFQNYRGISKKKAISLVGQRMKANLIPYYGEEAYQEGYKKNKDAFMKYILPLSLEDKKKIFAEIMQSFADRDVKAPKIPSQSSKTSEHEAVSKQLFYAYIHMKLDGFKKFSPTFVTQFNAQKNKQSAQAQATQPNNQTPPPGAPPSPNHNNGKNGSSGGASSPNIQDNKNKREWVTNNIPNGETSQPDANGPQANPHKATHTGNSSLTSSNPRFYSSFSSQASPSIDNTEGKNGSSGAGATTTSSRSPQKVGRSQARGQRASAAAKATPSPRDPSATDKTGTKRRRPNKPGSNQPDLTNKAGTTAAGASAGKSPGDDQSPPPSRAIDKINATELMPNNDRHQASSSPWKEAKPPSGVNSTHTVPPIQQRKQASKDTTAGASQETDQAKMKKIMEELSKGESPDSLVVNIKNAEVQHKARVEVAILRVGPEEALKRSQTLKDALAKDPNAFRMTWNTPNKGRGS